MARSQWGWVGSVGLCCCAGCSLLGWGDVDLASCREADSAGRSPCSVLDRRDGIGADACEHWQCRRDGRGCELRARDADDDGHLDAKLCRDRVASSLDCDDTRADRYVGLAESCDGIDNDCDGLIDEDVLADRSLAAREIDVGLPRAESAEIGPMITTAAPGTAITGTLSLVADGEAALIDLSADAARPVQYTFSGRGSAAAGANCTTARGPSRCNARQLALAAAGSDVLSAGVSDDSGCPHGELRLGVGALGAAELELLLGGNDTSRPPSTQWSVDAPGGGPCPARGVHNPAIAALDTETGAQALALWLAEPVDTNTGAACSAESSTAELRAIGVSVTRATPPYALSTNGGHSQTFARATSGSRPALASFLAPAAAGYIAAYGVGSELDLAIWPQLTAADTEGSSLPEPMIARFDLGAPIDGVSLAFTSTMADAEEAVSPPPSAAKAASAPVVSPPMAAIVRPLSAWAMQGSDGLLLAVAFRVGCAAQAEVRLARLALHVASASDFAISWLDSQVLSSPGADVSSGPQLVYMGDGLLAPDLTSAAPGGWTVAWVERSAELQQLMAARVSEAGDPIDAEPFRVVSGVDSVWTTAAVGGRVSYAIVKQDTAHVAAGSMLCSSPQGTP